MVHDEGWTIGPVPDGLNHLNRLQNVSLHGRPGPATQIGQLHGPGMSEGVAGRGAYGLPT